MPRRRSPLAFALAAFLAAAAALPARADVEVTDPQGRRVLLKDDGTWRFVDAQAAPAAPGASAAAQDEPQAELQLRRHAGTAQSCTFELVLTNTLPYEVRSLALDFTVLRPTGVAYLTQLAGFQNVRPGDSRTRNLRFDGIACADVATLKVSGGDRCNMGDLHKFSEDKGECLRRVKVMPSAAMKFEK